MSKSLTCDCLIIGSGPGGATTAMLLAEAGLDCILAEEGRHFVQGDIPSYSLEEMDSKYRYGGLSVSMGAPKVSFLEARCVGGASEVNAGLYNVPMDQTLMWARDGAIKDFSAQLMAPYFAKQESELMIDKYPSQLPMASQLIRRGAEKLGWKAQEIPRMWDYKKNKRQSMSEVFIPRFLKARGRLLTQSRIKQLKHKGRRAHGAIGAGR